MMTVRFPSGHFVTYNNAFNLRYEDGTWKLFTAKDNSGRWVASMQPSSGCLVEGVEPCKVGMADKSEMLKVVSANLRAFAGWKDLDLLATIKAELEDFNRQTKRWK